MNKNKIRLIVGIVAFIVVASAAVWYSMRDSGSLSAENPDRTLPPVTYEVAPSDWTVYDGSDLGFKVSHPKDWIIGSCGESCITFAKPDEPEAPIAGVNVTPGGTLDDVLVSAEPYIEASGSVSFNGLNWIRLVLREPQSGNVFISHFAESGKKLFELGLGLLDEDTVKLYGQMVSSFELSK